MTTNEYRWLNDYSSQFLERDYLLPGQTVDDRVTEICQAAENILKKSNVTGYKSEIIENFGSKLKENFKKGWYSFSSPVWSNFGTDRGLPISCFGSNIEDSMDSILEAHAEVGIMTKIGGGTSGYFGKLRPRGSKIRNNGESYGAVHFMQLFDTLTNVVSQGSTRRGSFAAYLDIEHGDIEEFLTIKSEGSPIQDMSFGVCIGDDWMNQMINGDEDKRRVWAKVLQSRANVGYPYIFFRDTANRNTVDVYKKHKMKITHSNLCTEIMLPNSPTESFVCDLSSMNLLYYDEWKDTDAVEVLTYFLDAVMTEFIMKGQNIKYLERAVKFAQNHRALGIGVLGWHSLLQEKMIPFESVEALELNVEIFQNIQSSALKASKELAEIFGAPKMLEEFGRRNTTLLAVAPTKSSAFILGQVSEGIEPHKANYYIKDLAKGKFTIKNRQLESLLESKGKNTLEVWDSILKNKGSVMHLDFLSDREKAVFKTFREISPTTIIDQAADRQYFIDQGQSVNVIISPTTPIKEVNKLYIDAWKKGVKSLYYQISVNAAQEFSRQLDCVSCEA